MQIPTLETQRLTLRENRLSDFEPLVEFYADPIRSAGFGGVLNRNDAWRWLASSIGHWQLRGYGFWTVEEKATGLFAGMVGLWSPEGWREPELGWILAANAEGRGIAYEAALATRTYTYDVMGWDTAISLIAASNQRSQTLAKRLDATLESSYVHPQFGDMQVWRHPAAGVLQ